MGDTSVVPSNSLTLQNPAPPPGVTGTPPSRFILFSNDWLDLQNYITRALALPINLGDFTAKYGDFSDQNQVNAVIAAMKNVQGLSADFGDPSTLRNQIIHNGSYLNGANPPSEIYGHIVWLANQIENTAATFTYTFQNLSVLIGPGAGTPDQRAQNLKDILVGQGGLVSLAADMKAKTAALSSKLATFDGKLSDANTQLLTYTNNESQILKDANAIIGQLNADVLDVQGKANEAYTEWRDYTISAVTVSVGILVLSCGLLAPVAAAFGIGLGIKAGIEKAKYNALLGLIGQDNAKILQKTQLVNDLTGLNTAIVPVSSTLGSFISNLQIIEGVWTDIGGRLQYIVSTFGVDQLGSLPWVTQAFDIGNAQKKWQDIADTSSQFTQHSLVNYVSGPSFGQAIS